jgi:hypothetical protein
VVTGLIVVKIGLHFPIISSYPNGHLAGHLVGHLVDHLGGHRVGVGAAL